MKRFLAILFVLFIPFITYSQCTTCALGCGFGCGCAGSFCMPLLPVHLISFDVKITNGVAEIKWVTSAEKDVSRFVLESGIKTNDSVPTFSFLRKISPAGKSGEDVNVYVVRDSSFQNSGSRYYRLLEYDINETVTILGTKFLEHSDATETGFLSAAPVPFQDQVKVSFSADDFSPAEVSLFNLYNQIRISQHVDAGVYETYFSTSHLPDGIYFISVKTGNYFKVIKVLKE